MHILTILALTFSTHAIEFLPCQRALQGSTWKGPDGVTRAIDPDAVVVSGPLHDHWETGYEDQTAWSIMDDHIYQKLSGNGYDALFVLSDGDQVFLLDGANGIKTWGEHREFQKRGTVHFQGRAIEVAPNRPRFVPAPGQPALSDDEYLEAFQREAKVSAIVRLQPRQIREIDQKLSHKLKQYEQHRQDPARFVFIGTQDPYELALFEESFAGTLLVGPDNLVSLATDTDQPFTLKFGDKLFLLDEHGRQFAKFETNRYPTILDGDKLEWAKKATRCVVVRRNY